MDFANYISNINTMERSWKDRMSKDPEYAYKRSYAKDAYYAECWVYSELTKKIYSPEEFMASTETISVRRGKSDDWKFKIMKPDVILEQKLLELNKLTQEITNLQNRMKDYYDIVRKKG